MYSLRSDFLAAPKFRKRFLQDRHHGWTVPRRCVNWSTRMLGPAKIYFIIFGILTIAGGIIGYVKAGSTPSLIAGSIAGLLLLIGAAMLPARPAGLWIVLIVSILLAGQFVPKFIQTGRAMPAGMMSILSVIGIVVAIIAWMKK